MQTTVQFLTSRHQLAKGEHKLQLEELANIVVVSCTCGIFHTIKPLSGRIEAGVEHYQHCELMRFEESITAKALEAVAYLII